MSSSIENPRSANSGFTPVEKLDELSPRQRREVRGQSRPNAALIHETIRSEGIGELERAASALALSALAAGLSMGFSMAVQGELRARLPAGPLRDLISPFGYTIGFLIVVLGRHQLFTENTLTPVLPLLHDRSRTTLMHLLKLWAIVLVCNMAGTFLFATVAAWSPLFDPAAMNAFGQLGRAMMEADFLSTFLRAVLAGWLIALMVWLLPGAESARTQVIIVLTYVIALCGFPHIIAGSVETLFLVQTSQASWRDFILRFFLPTISGNMIGGISLVAVLNYGQVAPEIGGAD